MCLHIILYGYIYIYILYIGPSNESSQYRIANQEYLYICIYIYILYGQPHLMIGRHLVPGPNLVSGPNLVPGPKLVPVLLGPSVFLGPSPCPGQAQAHAPFMCGALSGRSPRPLCNPPRAPWPPHLGRSMTLSLAQEDGGPSNEVGPVSKLRLGRGELGGGTP